MTIKAREFDALVRKLQMQTRDGRDLHAWFEFEGKVITRTRRSKGSGDLPMQHSIRQQLKVNEMQMRELIRCTLGRDDYLEILRNRGLLPE